MTMWLLRDNYGNPYCYQSSLTQQKTKLDLTFCILQFKSKEDAEAFTALKIVEGVWDQGVWHAETTETA